MICVYFIYGLLFLAMSYSQEITPENGNKVRRSASYYITGQIVPMDTNSPLAQKLAKQALKEYEIKKHTPIHHVVSMVTKATEQVVAGTNYVIDFIAKPVFCQSKHSSKCSKGHFPVDYELLCDSEIFSQPWIKRKEIKVACKKVYPFKKHLNY